MQNEKFNLRIFLACHKKIWSANITTEKKMAKMPAESKR